MTAKDIPLLRVRGLLQKESPAFDLYAKAIIDEYDELVYDDIEIENDGMVTTFYATEEAFDKIMPGMLEE